jgi:cytochrome c peroxidase
MHKKRIFTLTLVVVVTFLLTFCKRHAPVPYLGDSKEIPVLPDKPFDYPESSNDYLAALGRVLFYDKELSANKNISCGSCHQQKHAFTDNLRFSQGTNNVHTSRNTPSLFARNGRLFWDGRSHSLEDLVFRPIRDEVEMNRPDINALIERIASIDYYANLVPHAFPRKSKIDSNMIKAAMSEFLKNFNFADNKFQKSLTGSADLSESEVLGKDLFFGKANCANCHHIENDPFMGGNNGYGNTDISHNIGLDETNEDPGVGAVTRLPNDKGAFMMPVLLNIEHTAPYMHDGRFNTLEEVIDHYNDGVKNNPNLSFLLKDFNTGMPQKLNLTVSEKKALVDFLKTLTDPSIFTDEKYSDPFIARPQ